MLGTQESELGTLELGTDLELEVAVATEPAIAFASSSSRTVEASSPRRPAVQERPGPESDLEDLLREREPQPLVVRGPVNDPLPAESPAVVILKGETVERVVYRDTVVVRRVRSRSRAPNRRLGRRTRKSIRPISSLALPPPPPLAATAPAPIVRWPWPTPAQLLLVAGIALLGGILLGMILSKPKRVPAAQHDRRRRTA